MVSSLHRSAAVSLSLLLLLLPSIGSLSANFSLDFDITWGPNNVNLSSDGSEISLSLTNISGSAFADKNKYLFGQIDMDIKLVPGDSAGTVTAYYLHSQTLYHDEVDFEFLGNVSGEPYILQTNIFNNGTGGREQRIYLWFDPTSDFHTYTVLWNERQILINVDGKPIRRFPNLAAQGVPFLDKQAMGVFSSIWDGDSWATQGGAVKTNWTDAPFTSKYRNFKADACVWTGQTANCPADQWWTGAAYVALSTSQQSELKRIQDKYMVYNYCTDKKRYPVAPPECNL